MQIKIFEETDQKFTCKVIAFVLFFSDAYKKKVKAKGRDFF